MNETIQPQTTNLKLPSPRGFTLIEILVVIGIIVILLSILIPVVSKVRKSAQVASVQAQINSLAGAIQQYQQDYSALPGPLPYDQIRMTGFMMVLDSPNGASQGYDTNAGLFFPTKITMSENLVLGLAGGLKWNPTANAVQYDPLLVGGGPMGLNPANPKKGRAYIDQTNLSWREGPAGKTGKYQDNAGAADDSAIPEIVDTFPNPLPILYLRARKGVAKVAPTGPDDNSVITHHATAAGLRLGQYDTSQYIAYTMEDATGAFIGEGKSIRPGDYANPPVAPSDGKLPHGLTPPVLTKLLDKPPPPPPPPQYEYPYNAFPYFKNPASPATDPEARNKDGFILISAGLDRVYGTEDDITNFGSVTP